MTNISRFDEQANLSGSIEPLEDLSSSVTVFPTITVNLFGGFEMMVDGVPVDHPSLRRQKVKTLLAILVISGGRELSIEHLSGILWPDCDFSKHRNNFNNLWSLLRKVVRSSDGKYHPYLIRHQGTCKVDCSYVHTDLDEARTICDELQFGNADVERIIFLYRRLSQVVRGPLLPGEMENTVILRSRWTWKECVAEALYHAALDLQERGELRKALWLAREALSVDESREDILRLKMRLHMDQGNPSRALASFDGLRRALEEDYCLEPSPATLSLVDELLYGPAPAASPVDVSKARAPHDKSQGRAPSGRGRWVVSASDKVPSPNRNEPFPHRNG